MSTVLGNGEDLATRKTRFLVMERSLRNPVRPNKRTSGAKALKQLLGLCGTAKAVPFQNNAQKSIFQEPQEPLVIVGGFDAGLGGWAFRINTGSDFGCFVRQGFVRQEY